MTRNFSLQILQLFQVSRTCSSSTSLQEKATRTVTGNTQLLLPNRNLAFTKIEEQSTGEVFQLHYHQHSFTQKECLQFSSVQDEIYVLYLDKSICAPPHLSKLFPSVAFETSKAVFFSELQEGKRHHGAPRKHYKDQLRRQLAQEGISRQSWQQEA